ncbi:hypothetical protein ANN_09494, partial [Periplaneta americana]
EFKYKPQCSEDYTLVHVSLWSELYKGVKCGECGMDSAKAELTEPSGFAFKVIVKCYNCNTVLNEMYTSPKVGNTESTRPPFDVNRRMVNAFVTMGKGHSAMEQHCMAMGMAGLSSPSFNSHLIKLTEENKLVRQHVLRNAHSAVRRAHMEVDSSISDSDVINIGVSYDGTWMKRTYIKQLQVYGEGIDIRKEECVNHVAKRVGKGLQNIVREWRGTDSSIGGKKKGSLTAEMIPRLQNYYRKAIIDNISDVNKMKKAIYATLDHAMSTDDKPCIQDALVVKSHGASSTGPLRSKKLFRSMT